LRAIWKNRAGKNLSGKQFLFLVLELVELVIKSLFLDKLLVGSHFFKVAFVKHEDPVHVLDCRKAVGDDNGSAVFHHYFKSILDKNFRFRIDI
jgi:hypothetical protein